MLCLCINTILNTTHCHITQSSRPSNAEHNTHHVTPGATDTNLGSSARVNAPQPISWHSGVYCSWRNNPHVLNRLGEYDLATWSWELHQILTTLTRVSNDPSVHLEPRDLYTIDLANTLHKKDAIQSMLLSLSSRPTLGYLLVLSLVF